jgi:hypothetical protein
MLITTSLCVLVVSSLLGRSGGGAAGATPRQRGGAHQPHEGLCGMGEESQGLRASPDQGEPGP